MSLTDSLAIALARLAYDQTHRRYFSDVITEQPLRLVGQPQRVTEARILLQMVEAEAKGRGDG